MSNDKPNTDEQVRAFVNHVRNSKEGELRVEKWQVPFKDAFLGGQPTAPRGRDGAPERRQGKA